MMRLRMRPWFVTGVLGLSFVAKGAITYLHAETGSFAQTTALPKPTNLRVLPKASSLPDVYTRMAQIQKDLGVDCSFCHDQDPDSKQVNYASDENPRKETARAMMRMTQDINEKYLGALGDRQYSPPITCGNCHLGQMHPPQFEGK
ncbi:c-type cytochrome [Terriglobus roseus]|uniref:Photosynthetic reaction center cytochrome c subunit n=1 Tax=Terriglobus roseus TaxID=392734 RepID=A0A1G7GX84_9BACT|nr:c-type cytochrome [Terriglobus roseus]SDE92770.1 Photosynthetic reaction center cytochrome C subunit [Terriglobus roseus]